MPLAISLILCVVCFFIGINCLVQGFDKKDNYTYDNKYVGGDAYNYITNGTYFAGYCALGGSMFICSALFGTTCLKMIPGKKEHGDTEENTHTLEEKTVQTENVVLESKEEEIKI